MKLLAFSLVGSFFTIIILFLLYRNKEKSQKLIHEQHETIKNEQHSLKIQKKRLELVLEGTGLGLWDWNLQSNEIIYDQRWASILGYTLSETNHTIENWKSKVHPDDLSKCFEDFELYMSGNCKFYSNIHRMKHKDGGWRHILSQGKITEYNNGKPIRFTGTHMDITYIKEIEIKLQKEQYKSDQYIQLIDKYIISSATDLEGKITDASEAYCKISGYSKEELIGQTHSVTKHPEMDPKIHKQMWDTITQDKTWQGEIMNKNKFGKTYHIYGTISPKYNQNGEKIGYTSIRQDITDKKRIEQISITDQLTQLYNRVKLEEIFNLEIPRAQRYHHGLSFIMIDIDYFKSVNDTFGHDIGDITLQSVANLLKENTRKSDIVGRWGGEEFLIIVPETNLEDTVSLAEKIRKSIEEYDFIDVGKKTASFGVSIFEKNDTKTTLIKKADNALYTAKKKGRNRIEVST